MQSALIEMLGSHSTLAMAVCDVGGNITLATPALTAMVGWSSDRGFEGGATELDVYDSTGRRILQREELPHLRALKGESVIDQMCTLKSTDRGMKHLRCNAAPLRADDGRIRGAVCLIQDVTIEWSAMLRQKELRDRLLTTVNHELRTPMTIIVGHAEILSQAVENADVPDVVRRSVGAICRASHQLGGIANAITQLGDLEDVTNLSLAPTDVFALVRDVGEVYHVAASAVDRTLVCDAPGRLEVRADSRLLRLAVEELVDNALVHAPPKGCIALRAVRHAGNIEISVSDDGPGIAADDRSRVVRAFERGEHLDPSTSSQGLGLALVDAVASAHGGSLHLQNNSPQGLLATIRIAHEG